MTRSFLQTPELVCVNSDTHLSLEAFLQLVPSYHLHKEYTQVQYVAKERVTFIQDIAAIDMSSELDDDVMWPLGEQWITAVEEASKTVEVEDTKQERIPTHSDITLYLSLSKKDRKSMLSAIPLLADKEVIKNLLKRARNSLLINSDWTVMPDYPFSDEERAPWLAYRKELRDYMQLVKDKDVIDIPQLPKAPN
jgi:hypothetical protein